MAVVRQFLVDASEVFSLCMKGASLSLRPCSSQTLALRGAAVVGWRILREYAVDYSSTLKETGAAVHMWLPD